MQKNALKGSTQGDLQLQEPPRVLYVERLLNNAKVLKKLTAMVTSPRIRLRG